MIVRNKKIYCTAEQWFFNKQIEGVFEKDEDMNSIIAANKDNMFECAAYLKTEEGKTLIQSGDWILTEKSGLKHVVSDEKFKDYFEKISDQFIYEPLEIPSFEEFNLQEDEIKKCKKMYAELSYILRENCELMDVHLASYVSSKLKEEVKKAMQESLNAVLREAKRRGMLENEH